MKCAWLFLISFACLFSKWYLEVAGLGYDDLDFVRSTIESVSKSITSKDVNLNKFNEAMDQVERAMTQAELSRKRTKMTDLKKNIVSAVNGGNVIYARRALGIALYTARKESKRLGKRSTGYDAKKFLEDIKRDLGTEKFSESLALQGQVTLMYALDVTGSMSEEINACKNIIKKINKYDRSEPVDYILTTFSDPIDLTTANYYAEDEVGQLESKLGGLPAEGGGDCAEYSFDGMISALSENPRWGSPLYVFTDAAPKDFKEENMESLEVLAEELGVTINFFVGKNFCGSETQQQPFKDIAEKFGGQYLRLDPLKFTELTQYTSDSLEGTTPVVTGKNEGTSGKRRRRSTSSIAIPVDDTVTKLIVTIVTKHPHSVQLFTPTGRTQTSGRKVLSGVVIFSITHPIKGFWRLVPPSTDKYEFTAKVSSPENIDFEHYFSKNERGKLVPLRNPLSGQSVQVSITVSGASKIRKSSLLVDVIDIAGNTLVTNKKLTEAGKSGIRFIFNFVPPNKPFKLLLKGKTTGSKNFQRISRHVDSSKPLVIKEFYTSKHYTIPQKGSTFVILYLFNGLGRQKTYNVSFKTREGYAASLPGSQRLASRMKVRGNSKKYLRVKVRYTGGTPGKIGETLNVVIIVKGRDNSFITTELVPLMII
ncbi:hemicentin-1-like [Dendronephthya gigantea]|uniref:hemicentin-1-like n=1 Tax=Dendronephthya gigantea TaxID=151771 RepID=UPI00106ADCD7|nr:hemicentin-1-like [Dendronephthya gigantea]